MSLAMKIPTPHIWISLSLIVLLLGLIVIKSSVLRTKTPSERVFDIAQTNNPKSNAENLKETEIKKLRSLFQTQVQECDFFEARGTLKTLGEITDTGDLAIYLDLEIERRIIEQCAKDPEALLDLMASGKSQFQIYWIEVAMRHYLRADLVAATNWFDKNKSKFNEATMDRLALALGRYVLSEHSFSKARQASLLIEEEALRSVLKVEIDRGIEFWIREGVLRNPEQTMNDLVRGTSNLEVFWLEVGMRCFFEVDQPRASEWHTEHWDTLNVDQKDRVALAWAREAIMQEDYDLARSWIEEISDEHLVEVLKKEMLK